MNRSPKGASSEVSDDGTNFVVVPGVEADSTFPTLGYLDLGDAFQTTSGSVLSDFTLPVDPAVNIAGFTFAQIVTAYNGSGGGSGVDLAAVGLSQISFVRITNPVGSGNTPEIDALADVAPVPEPLTALPTLLGWLGLCMTSSCRSRVRVKEKGREHRAGASNFANLPTNLRRRRIFCLLPLNDTHPPMTQDPGLLLPPQCSPLTAPCSLPDAKPTRVS